VMSRGCRSVLSRVLTGDEYGVWECLLVG
jgi:hypothetical protein